MTSKPASKGNGSAVPVLLIVMGCVLFVGATIGMIVAGYVIDEQKIDPGDSLLPLWFSFFGGPVVAAFGAGWLNKRRKG